MSDSHHCTDSHCHGDTWKTKVKATCNVLCYCRSDTPSRLPRAPKLAWTPSRLLLLHFNNTKPAEKFDDIISKLQEKLPDSSPGSNSNHLAVPESTDGEISRRGSTMGDRRMSIAPDGRKQSAVLARGPSGKKRKRKPKRRKSMTPAKSDLYEPETVVIE